MFGPFQKSSGKVLVVSDPKDSRAQAAMNTFLVTAPPGAAMVRPPTNIPNGYQLSTACFFSSDPKNYTAADSALLTQLNGALRPGGILRMHLGGLTDQAVGEIELDLLMQGLVSDLQGTRKVPSKQSPGLVDCLLTSQKPVWNMGESAALKKKGKEDLIDEDQLLEGKEAPKAVGEGQGGCSTKPRACANCSCGRKELEEKMGDAEAAKKALEQGTVRSSCNNCYLGDAFRCASCPYRGQPAFKPGTKVELDTETSNTGQVDLRQEEEDGAVIGKDGKIMIN